MKIISTFCILLSALLFASSCTPNRGCIEPTAENYDIEAEEDDGTCIESRDKLIGMYAYTRIWTDVFTAYDTIDFGTIQITETNTGRNKFIANFAGGSLFLHGAITADDLLFETLATATDQYTGTGTWLRQDSVNLVLNVSYLNFILTVPQPYTYYCTKLPE